MESKNTKYYEYNPTGGVPLDLVCTTPGTRVVDDGFAIFVSHPSAPRMNYKSSQEWNLSTFNPTKQIHGIIVNANRIYDGRNTSGGDCDAFVLKLAKGSGKACRGFASLDGEIRD